MQSDAAKLRERHTQDVGILLSEQVKMRDQILECVGTPLSGTDPDAVARWFAAELASTASEAQGQQIELLERSVAFVKDAWSLSRFAMFVEFLQPHEGLTCERLEAPQPYRPRGMHFPSWTHCAALPVMTGVSPPFGKVTLPNPEARREGSSVPLPSYPVSHGYNTTASIAGCAV